MTEPGRGTIEPTDKEKEDRLAIGGMCDAAGSVGRLHRVTEVGLKVGAKLDQLLDAHRAWAETTAPKHH